MHRADGTIQYAENPPKKYQDIYPLDFEGDDWQALWQALRDVVEFWIDAGVTVFRVDNPHTKPFAFWEWLIARVRRAHPEVIFLAEAFSRPRIMERLAKVGFSQSYTYFTWRQTQWELEEYFTDLSTRTVRLLPPERLAEHARTSSPSSCSTAAGRCSSRRAILAATLSPSWGIYGPAFELVEHTAVRAGQRGVPRLREVPAPRRGTSISRTRWHRCSRRLNEIRRAPSRAAAPRRAALPPHATTSSCSASRKIDPAVPRPGAGDRQPRPVSTRRRAGSTSISRRSTSRTSPTTTSHDELGGGTYRGAERAGSARPDGLAAHVFSVTPVVPHAEGRGDPEADLDDSEIATRATEDEPRKAACQSQRDGVTDGAARPRAADRAERSRTPSGTGRDHLRAARPRVRRRQRRRHRRLRRPAHASSTTSTSSASPRSGCCRSTRRRSATAATTSPTSSSIDPDVRRPPRRSAASSPRPTSAACGSSPSSCSTTRRTSTRGSSGPAARRQARGGATTTCGATRPTGTPTRGSSSRTSRRRTGRGTPSPTPTSGTASTATSPTSTSTTPRSRPRC